MCDYSLHGVASRPARVGDKLVSSGFRNSITRGFSTSEQPDVAICLMPGTDLAFEGPVEAQVIAQAGAIRNYGQSVARFRQVNLETPLAHHDALEFPDGEIILVNNLREGQRATVLQLPSTCAVAHGHETPAESTPSVEHDASLNV